MTSQAEQPAPDEPTASLVLTERVDATFVVTLNRPAVRNAIDRPTASALVQAFQPTSKWFLSMEDALHNETRHGIEVLHSAEAARGAQRFASGRGRHGDMRDI